MYRDAPTHGYLGTVMSSLKRLDTTAARTKQARRHTHGRIWVRLAMLIAVVDVRRKPYKLGQANVAEAGLHGGSTDTHNSRQRH